MTDKSSSATSYPKITEKKMWKEELLQRIQRLELVTNDASLDNVDKLREAVIKEINELINWVDSSKRGKSIYMVVGSTTIAKPKRKSSPSYFPMPAPSSPPSHLSPVLASTSTSPPSSSLPSTDKLTENKDPQQTSSITSANKTEDVTNKKIEPSSQNILITSSQATSSTTMFEISVETQKKLPAKTSRHNKSQSQK
jgi:hypothetical protein